MDAVTREDGFSLPELLVAMLIAALTMTALLNFTVVQSRAFARVDARLAASQDMRLVLDVISRDVRQAGFDARGLAVEPVVAASAARLILQRDENEDGMLDASGGERISYRFRPGVGTLSRMVGRQSMPLASHLPPDGFRLSYVDARGAPLRPDGVDLTPAERAAVRRIDVTLMARAADGAPLTAIATGVALRNLPWMAAPDTP
jgi:prepilin-type N-terminal cleavage/methylation domain-containing protein